MATKRHGNECDNEQEPLPQTDLILPSLPLSLWARILSYNVATTSDVARLRLFSKKESIVSLLPSLAPNSGHSIACPNKKCRNAFVQELVDADEGIYEDFDVCIGDVYKSDNGVGWVKLFESSSNCSVTSVQIIGEPIMVMDKRFESDLESLKFDEKHNPTVMLDVCARMAHADTIEELKGFYDRAESLGLLNALNPQASSLRFCYELLYSLSTRCYPVLLTLKVHNNSCAEIRPVGGMDNRFWEVSTFCFGQGDLSLSMIPLQAGCKFCGVSIPGSGDSIIHVLMNLLMVPSEFVWDEIDRMEYRMSSRLVYSSLWNRFQNNTKCVEGVTLVDDGVSGGFWSQLQSQLNVLARKQDQDGTNDYEPSKSSVRHLVNPELYCYANDVSRIQASTRGVSPSSLPFLDDVTLAQTDSDSDHEDDEKDFWGRRHIQNLKHQWLPTYVVVSQHGDCKILDYINNLTPRNDPVHADLHGSLSRLLEQALPHMESVFSYAVAVRKELRGESDVFYRRGHAPVLSPLDVKHISLRGQSLQVVAKIFDYELAPGQSYEGDWQVEGVANEEVVLTCLYILHRDVSLDGGQIAFKRASLKDEAQYIFSTVSEIRPYMLRDLVEQGIVPLGQVETVQGRMIVFPNSHIYKVCKMTNTATGDKGELAKLRCICFCLVNPYRRIVSTREVAPQQKHAGGTMTQEAALQHRRGYKKERQLHGQDWNVRELELW